MDYFENRVNFTLPNELNMYYCGKREKTLNHSYGPKINDHFLLVFVLEGNAVLYYRGKEVPISAGSLLTMFPDEEIHYKVNKGQRWTIKWIGVYGDLVYKYLKSINVTDENPVMKVNNIDEIEVILDELFENSLKDTLSDKIYSISLVHSIFSVLSKNLDNIKSVSNFTDDVKKFIKLHYADGITVLDVARKFNYTRCHFTKTFTQKAGISPMDYIMKQRIKKAKNLLVNTNYSIKTIAHSVGISDQLYFSKIFKNATGKTPSEYRNR